MGGDVSLDQGKQAARAVAIDLLGTLHAATEDLNRIRRIVKLMVLVNSTPSFTEFGTFYVIEFIAEQTVIAYSPLRFIALLKGCHYN